MANLDTTFSKHIAEALEQWLIKEIDFLSSDDGLIVQSAIDIVKYRAEEQSEVKQRTGE